MRSDELLNIFGVFVVLVHLRNEGKPHTIKEIGDAIKSSISNNVILKAIDYLEKWRVIVQPKGLPKGSRKGQTYTYNLFPERLPRFLLEVTLSEYTIERHKKRMAKKGLGRLKYGKLNFSADGFLSQLDDDWVRDVDNAARTSFPKARIDRNWLQENLEGGVVEFQRQPILAFLKTLENLKSQKQN